MKILITGSSGFIGFHLSKHFLESGNKVIGIDNLNSYYSVNLKKSRLKLLQKNNDFKFFKFDLKKNSTLQHKLKPYKIKQIIHLAAQPGVRISIKKPLNTLNENLIPFINVLEIARIKKVKKFIYASSSSVYGDSKIYPFNENDNKNIPVSVYGASKLSNEIIAQSYSKNFKIKCIGIRFFTVYGPYGRPDMAYYSFLERLKKNKSITVFNKGLMKRDFTFIDDGQNPYIGWNKIKIVKDRGDKLVWNQSIISIAGSAVETNIGTFSLTSAPLLVGVRDSIGEHYLNSQDCTSGNNTSNVNFNNYELGLPWMMGSTYYGIQFVPQITDNKLD